MFTNTRDSIWEAEMQRNDYRYPELVKIEKCTNTQTGERQYRRLLSRDLIGDCI